MKSKAVRLFVLFTIVFILLPISSEAVKIVTWNILSFPGTDFEERIDDFRLILDEIDPDILVVQQMLSQEGVTKFKNKILNYKSTKPYAKAPFFDGPDTDNAVFYKKEIMKLIFHQQIPTPLRDISEYYFKIKKGPGKKKSFRVFSVHFKAGKSTSDKKAREKEAKILRDYLNTLPRKSLFIVCGDFNIYGSDEKAFEILTRAQLNNNGRLIDPIRKIDSWHDKKKYAEIHTQSTRKTSFGGGAPGGLDDRFDMFLISYGLAGSYKLTYKPNSYLVFGNDGKHLNDAINFPENEAVGEKMADALHGASDHLPVIIELEPPTASLIPDLIRPRNGAVLDNGRTDGLDDIIWDFSWTKVNGATLYNLYVMGENAIYPIIDNNTSETSYHHVSGGHIIERHRYNWKWMVRAHVNGQWQDWSEMRYFDVEPVNTDPPFNCYPNLPNPNLIYLGSENYVGSDGREYTRYRIGVSNSEDYPDELFEATPHLPPCGLNPNASRSWVEIYDNNNNRLYGFCAFVESDDLRSFWFARLRSVAPPASVYIQIHDRECDIIYTSNLAPIIE